MKNTAAPIPYAPSHFNEASAPQHRSPLEPRTNIETVPRCEVAVIEIINGPPNIREWLKQERKA
jgi:hypothetical protein